MTRGAFTLVEVLVALTIGSLVLGLAMATGVATRRVQATLDARATDAERTTAVPQLLSWAIGRAGRGVEGCAASVAGDHALWRGTGVEPGEPVATTVEVLAGRDGGGRPALYHRTLPWPRQPWVPDVVGFAVLEARDADGAWRPWVSDGVTRWTAVRVALSWTDGDARTYEVALPHAPCAVAP